LDKDKIKYWAVVFVSAFTVAIINLALYFVAYGFVDEANPEIHYRGTINIDGINFTLTDSSVLKNAKGVCYRDDKLGVYSIILLTDRYEREIRKTCNHEMLHFYLNNPWNNYTKEHEFIYKIENYVNLPICDELIRRVS